MAGNPDEPNKRTLLALDTIYSIISDDKRCQGFFIWDAIPPVNVGYQAHKFSVLDAFQTGLAMLRTRFVDQWVLLGPMMAAVVVTLPQFICVNPPEPFGRYLRIGDIGHIKVYADPGMADPHEWWVGGEGLCVKGSIVYSPIAFGPPRPW